MKDLPAGVEERVPLAPLTTLQIGGPARYLAPVATAGDLEAVWRWARKERLEVLFLGEGSNVLFPDEGFDGLIVVNRCRGIEFDGREVRVAGGESLGPLIEELNRRNLAGMERMYGIPGSVAGAVVGNAGAYGQEIREVVADIEILSPEGRSVIRSAEAGFDYRHSAFKERRDWFLLSCTLRAGRGSGLQKISDEILALREVKYPPGLRCPGSFFKNMPVEKLSAEALRRVPPEFIQFGKIPAGKLLEAVGARGARLGDAQVADYHGNLIMNRGFATCREILELTGEFSERVRERFNIQLEPEILIVRKSS